MRLSKMPIAIEKIERIATGIQAGRSPTFNAAYKTEEFIRTERLQKDCLILTWDTHGYWLRCVSIALTTSWKRVFTSSIAVWAIMEVDFRFVWVSFREEAMNKKRDERRKGRWLVMVTAIFILTAGESPIMQIVKDWNKLYSLSHTVKRQKAKQTKI